MRRWEYKKVALNDAPRRCDEIDLLCDAGEDGWELVAITANNSAYLKRELTDTLPETEERESEEPLIVVPAATASNGETASQVKPKYRDSITGDTWSGRGRMASWLKRKQESGEDIERYRV